MTGTAGYRVGETSLVLVRGDITDQTTEAIVNAANSTLMGGGGVDGAIHRAGGPGILAECKQIIHRIGSLPAGEAVVTCGGDLAARFVVHTVGPVWSGGNRNEDDILARAYRNSLAVARQKNIRTISFPSISTGAYRFPVQRAANVALAAVAAYLEKEGGFDEVRIVLWKQDDFDAYAVAAAALFAGR